VVLTLAVFAANLAMVHVRLRERLREQIANRDAAVLHGLAVLQSGSGVAGLAGDPELELEGVTGDAEVDAVIEADQLREAVGRLKGVLAARVFGASGDLILALPPFIAERRIPPAVWERVEASAPLARFWPRIEGDELVPGVGVLDVPVLETWIPLTGGGGQRAVGVVQLLLDGSSIAAEYAALDRHLVREGCVTFAGGAVVIGVGLGWVLGRLRRAHRLLEDRTRRLVQANQELAMGARTSAVGAVTAHLMHSLKNPLSGLQQFVASGVRGDLEGSAPVWEEAADSTRRMQAIVQEVLRLLRDEGGAVTYEVSYGELVDSVAARAGPAAREAGVVLEREGEVSGRLANRDANLVGLILENLVANAIQASPRGGVVRLCLGSGPRGVVIAVHDQGSGLPEAVRAALFNPVRSTKPGGTGIGLAICRQLAGHLGARLALVASGPTGCVFSLELPR